MVCGANHCQLIDRAEIIPTPADDLEVSEVGLPLARQGMFTCPKGASR